MLLELILGCTVWDEQLEEREIGPDHGCCNMEWLGTKRQWC